MLFKNIGIVDENYQYQKDMFVGIKDEKIAYISSKEPEEDFGEVYDGKGKILMPAFYNAHGHSPMTLLRGYGENLNLQDWLFNLIFPFEDHLDSDAVYWGQMMAMAESFKYGIASTSDMYYFTDDMVRATIEAGAKINVSRAVSATEIDAPSLKDMNRLIQEYKTFKNDKIIFETSIHAEYTNNEAVCRYIAEAAKENGLGMHVHVSETRPETEECKARNNGMTPTQFLDMCGAFDVRAIAAHCVWCTDEDLDILKAKNVTIASNPVSNLKLVSGNCRSVDIYNKGINLAIGTDSVASNNSLNFFEEMKLFTIAGKMTAQDPAAMRPEQVLHSATRAGAIAQGREDCGLLKEGFKADLMVLDGQASNMQPEHNAINNIIYAADPTNILMTMVDGKVVYKNGEYTTIDMEKTIFNLEKQRQRILGELAAEK
ncbi:MAG: amidohydrolase [Clostridia bacterium]|nr:amidohydrolase [Clostridia bacterium]